MNNDSPHATAQFPQFRVISAPNFIEYRVYNFNPQDNSLGLWNFADALWVVIVSYVLYTCGSRTLYITGGLFVLYVYMRCTSIIYESIIALPQCGIQLETHRGFSTSPLFAVRRFIPKAYVKDIIINEGLRRWNVRYYLAVLVHPPDGSYELAVPFENILPRLPILLDVFRGVRRDMGIE